MLCITDNSFCPYVADYKTYELKAIWGAKKARAFVGWREDGYWCDYSFYADLDDGVSVWINIGDRELDYPHVCWLTCGSTIFLTEYDFEPGPDEEVKEEEVVCQVYTPTDSTEAGWEEREASAKVRYLDFFRRGCYLTAFAFGLSDCLIECTAAERWEWENWMEEKRLNLG